MIICVKLFSGGSVLFQVIVVHITIKPSLILNDDLIFAVQVRFDFLEPSSADEKLWQGMFFIASYNSIDEMQTPKCFMCRVFHKNEKNCSNQTCTTHPLENMNFQVFFNCHY